MTVIVDNQIEHSITAVRQKNSVPRSCSLHDRVAQHLVKTFGYDMTHYIKDTCMYANVNYSDMISHFLTHICRLYLKSFFPRLRKC